MDNEKKLFNFRIMKWEFEFKVIEPVLTPPNKNFFYLNIPHYTIKIVHLPKAI